MTALYNPLFIYLIFLFSMKCIMLIQSVCVSKSVVLCSVVLIIFCHLHFADRLLWVSVFNRRNWKSCLLISIVC